METKLFLVEATFRTDFYKYKNKTRIVYANSEESAKDKFKKNVKREYGELSNEITEINAYSAIE